MELLKQAIGTARRWMLYRKIVTILACVLVVELCFESEAVGQALAISNGVVTYTGLTNMTVVMTGICELRVTGRGDPIPGCTVHLNSPDAYLVFSSIRPSTVASSLLSRVRVNGAQATAGVNCRVVTYGDGTVIVPHGASYAPLQVFTGLYFTGASSNLGTYVYYRGAGLGQFNGAIGSFKLKRGYAVTFASEENGTGYSVNYVAADGDLEVGVLPSGLRRVRFVYVVPWRWASKKGIAGDIESGLNVTWKYNWNLNQNSTLDIEYVPIKQNRWWPSLSQDWKARGSVHLLGFNEPDKSDQANMTVDEAIAAWPELLATGLRVGSPATTDGGRSSWLYPFISQADSSGLRVDFVAVHYYWCYDPANPSGAASQFYNFLKAVYDQTKRPIWITEWNNGANWTSCADPTFQQQAACVAAMIQMLEDTPWVERYAIYNWVEDCRRVKWDDGSLTLAGEVYRDQPSRIGYLQTVPDTGTRSFGQYSFEGHTLDVSGYGNNGVTSGCPIYTNGRRGLAIVFDGENTRVTLPPNVARGSAFSFAAWVYWAGGANWQRIFDFGNSTTHYMFLTPRSSAGTMRFAIKNGGSEQQINAPFALPTNQWTHVAVTLSGGRGFMYVNGQLVASNVSLTITPADFSPRYNFLGRSQFIVDPHFKGMMDEVLITDYALSAANVASLMTNSPPLFTNAIFVLSPAFEGQPYSNNIAGFAIDPDPGDTLQFSKPAGPGWLNISTDGVISGTPTSGDGGTNYFTVRVYNPGGYSGFAVVAIPVTVFSASGTWAVDADGVWSDTNRWQGGVVASGAGHTADFSKLNITADRTVTLDSSRSIGILRFSDTAGTQSWIITNANEAVLTLETGTSSAPQIFVTNTAILALPLAGTNGFVKSGPGTLVLAGENLLRGTLDIDTGSTSANDGIVRVAHPRALANISHIRLRNNNSGYSTLQLDGTLGSVVYLGQMTVSCRNNDVPAIHHLKGTNNLGGFIGLEVGGNRCIFRSDEGLLVISGTNQYVGSLTGARTYIFTGAGDHLVTGPIRNSTNGAPIHLAKLGTGTLTLAGVNDYSGTTSISNGVMYVNGVISTGAVTVATGATLGGQGTINGPVTVVSGGILSPGVGIGRLTINNSVTLQPGSISRFELDKSQNTNDFLRANGTLTLGGTLVVVSTGGTLCPGDSFTLFSAANVVGTFSAMVLPPLNYGLSWDTSGLTNGVLSVVATNPPRIMSAELWPDGSFRLSGRGSANQRYVLMSTTNLNPPVIWSPVTNSLADTNGLFEFTDPSAPGFSHRFYRIQVLQ